jgi:hypothetical protein
MELFLATALGTPKILHRKIIRLKIHVRMFGKSVSQSDISRLKFWARRQVILTELYLQETVGHQLKLNIKKS